jgi:hypothetical protein
MKDLFKINIGGARIYNKSNRNSSILVIAGILNTILAILYAGWFTNWSPIIVILILPISFGIFSLIYQPIVINGKFFNQLINTVVIESNSLSFTTLSWHILGISIYKSKSHTISIDNLIISQIPLKILKNKWWYMELSHETIYSIPMGMKRFNNKNYLLIPDLLENGELLQNKLENIKNQKTTANKG